MPKDVCPVEDQVTAIIRNKNGNKTVIGDHHITVTIKTEPEGNNKVTL